MLVTSVIVMAAMAFLVLERSRKLSSVYFSLFVIAVIIWVFANIMANIAINQGPDSYLFWSKMALIGPTIAPFFLLCFADLFPEGNRFTVNKFIYLAITSIGTTILFLVPTHYNIESVLIKDASTFQTTFTPGILYSVFGVYFLASITIATVVLIRKYFIVKSSQKSQIIYVLSGILATVTLGVVANVVLPLLGNALFINFTPLSTIFITGFTSYAIIAHHLFDIRVIIRRTVVYSVLLLFVLVAYALVVFSFSQLFGGDVTFGVSSFIPNIIAALLIAFGFDPLKRWLQTTTDKYLFKGEYEPQDVANNLARALSNAINLDESLDSMMAVLTKEMRIGHVATLVVRKVDKDNTVKRVKATGFSNLVKLEALPTGHLVEYFAKNPKLIVVEELKDQSDRTTINHDLHPVLNQLEQFQTAIALPLLVKNNVIGVLLIGEKLSGDIFSRQDLEVLELIGNQTALSIEKAQFYEEDKLKSEFISIASHELLTPTAAIEGYLSMALDKKMPQTISQQTQYIQRAYDSSRRLADLVKDLLSISRIESGRIKIVSIPLDIVAILDQAVGELQPTAKAKGLSITYTKPTGIPKVLADPDRVMQVCINLINNAIKYTPKGSVTITVELLKNMVQVDVKDSGIGIDKKDQQHLFEKFHRIDNPATTGIMGTGLGLYISKNIISLLGGEMTVQSAAGQGSTFTFSLPVAK